jgi:hypothetical protein
MPNHKCAQHISLGCAPKEFFDFLKANIYWICIHKEYYFYSLNKLRNENLTKEIDNTKFYVFLGISVCLGTSSTPHAHTFVSNTT